jgi:hypothetical protein
LLRSVQQALLLLAELAFELVDRTHQQLCPSAVLSVSLVGPLPTSDPPLPACVPRLSACLSACLPACLLLLLLLLLLQSTEVGVFFGVMSGVVCGLWVCFMVWLAYSWRAAVRLGRKESIPAGRVARLFYTTLVAVVR